MCLFRGKMITSRLTEHVVAVLLVLMLPGLLLAGTLDDYYLARFGESGLRYAVGALSQTAVRAERCGTPLRRGLKSDWLLLSTTTRKILAKYLALPSLSGSELTLDSPTGRFRVHYTTVGADAATTAWAQTTAQIFDEVYGVEVQNMGYKSPPAVSAGAPYDIYLQDRASAGEYGYTQEISPTAAGSVSYSAYTVVDRSFTSSIFAPYTPLESLQVTAAHEFHHSIQFGYNYYFDIWYGEATATWMEDEVYDGVNQLYEYLPVSAINTSLSLDTPVNMDTAGGYGRWIFNRYLAERHGKAVVRAFWENLELLPAPVGGGDIPMIPLLDTVLTRDFSSTLPKDFFGYVKRLYTRDWVTHTNEIDPPTTYIPRYLPRASYSSYPVTVLSTPTPEITLPHYSYAYFQLPATSSGVTITINKDAGMNVTAFRSSMISGTPIDEYQAVVSGGQLIISLPAKILTGEIVLLVCNSTSNDNLSASFSSDVAFISPQPVMIGQNPYQDLQSAYDSAVSGDIIMLNEGEQAGSLRAGMDKKVTIKGGYSPSYTGFGSDTILLGTLTLRRGSVILDELVVR